jgi:hypothetical protein
MIRCSNLFSHDEYIKLYLLNPDLPLIFKIKIGLRYYVTTDLILQLNVLKEHIGIKSFADPLPQRQFCFQHFS